MAKKSLEELKSWFASCGEAASKMLDWLDSFWHKDDDIQADWDEEDDTSVHFIKNKPGLDNLGTQADWDEENDEEPSYIKNKPNLDNVGAQADWNEDNAESPSYIKNKPPVGDDNIQSDWNEDDTNKDAYILNKPIIPDAQIQSDWNQGDDLLPDYIKNKPQETSFFIFNNVTDDFIEVEDTARSIILKTPESQPSAGAPIVAALDAGSSLVGKFYGIFSTETPGAILSLIFNLGSAKTVTLPGINATGNNLPFCVDYKIDYNPYGGTTHATFVGIITFGDVVYPFKTTAPVAGYENNLRVSASVSNGLLTVYSSYLHKINQ